VPPAAQWIAPDWKDPAQVLPDVSLDGVPLTEIARMIRGWFKDSVEVIVPASWESPPLGANARVINFSLDAVSVHLHVKNVNAEELFNAMNLTFEAENSPVRWQLLMNGDRPLAVLRVLPALLPGVEEAKNEGSSTAPAAPPPEKKRMVFFVGDLVGEGMNMEKLYRIVCDVYEKGYAGTGGPTAQNDIKFHEDAQLLIVNSTPDRVDFVQNTLHALRDKARLDATAAGSNAKKESPKKPEATAESKP
jgi:hypothetical protein